MTIDAKRDVEILNESLGVEFFGIAAYDAALRTGLLDESAHKLAESFQKDRLQHAQRIREVILELGGQPIKPKSWNTYASESPPPRLDSQEDVLRYAASLEREAASASIASVRKFSLRQLAVLICRIAGVEAMHWSVLLSALGEDPVPVSFIPFPSP